MPPRHVWRDGVRGRSADPDWHFIHPLLEANAAGIARTDDLCLLFGSLEILVVGFESQVFKEVHVDFLRPCGVDHLVTSDYHVALSATWISGLRLDRSLDEVVAFLASLAWTLVTSPYC